MKKTALFLITIFVLLSARMVSSQDAGFFMPQSELQPKYEKLPPVPSVQPRLPSARAAYEQRRRQQAQNTNNPQAIAVQPVVRRKVKQYIAIDGRFVPIYEDEPQRQETQVISETETPAPDIPAETDENNLAETNSAFPEKQDQTLPIEQKFILPPVQTAFLPADQHISTGNPEPIRAIGRETLPVDNINVAVKIPQAQTASANLPDYRNSYANYLNNLQVFHQSGQMPYDENLEKTLSKISHNRKTVLFKGIVK